MSPSEYLSGLDKSELINEIRDLKNRVRSLELKKLNYNQVDEVTNDLGLMLAGEFRTGNGVEPGSGFTGGRFGYPGFEYDGVWYFFVGVNNDVLMVGIDLVTGKLFFGGGAGSLGENGIEIVGDASGVPNAYRIVSSTGNLIGEFRGSPGAVGGGQYTGIYGKPKSGTVTYVTIQATGHGHTADSNDAYVELVVKDDINTRYISLESTQLQASFINLGINVNSSQEDIDSFIKGISGSIMTFDAGAMAFKVNDGTLINAMDHGVWTPTLTNSSNISSSTAYEGQFIRVGDIVHCSVAVEITPTSAAACQLQLTLPVVRANNFADAYSGSGAGAVAAISLSGAMNSVATTKKMVLKFLAPATTAREWRLTFSYKLN